MDLVTSRPRVLGWIRSAAILDGDWGTSIAYVLGIAFALGGPSSSFHLVMMLGLTTLVALNYITICRLYPDGGGVYSSLRSRARVMAVIGALMLAADYIVTASLSVLEACHYLNLPHPVFFASVIIILIGILNVFGPRHAGTLAVIISTGTLLTLVVLAFFAFPAVTSNAGVRPVEGGLIPNWHIFVGVILSISGIESISNMTSVMKDPARSSRRAILSVLVKIVTLTLILGIAMNALPETILKNRVEDMLRFLGEYYVGEWFGPLIGIALGFLLISAGNTAINALMSLQFLMSADRELPSALRRLNRYGVPYYALAVAVALPLVILLIEADVVALASLYAIGVVGAILINIFSTGINRALTIPAPIRGLMMASAAVLFMIEVTIAIDKSAALIFAIAVITVGMTARTLTRVRAQRVALGVAGGRRAAAEVEAPGPVPPKPAIAVPSGGNRILVAVHELSENLLRRVCEETRLQHAFLFVLNLRQLSVSGELPATLSGDVRINTAWIDSICTMYDIPYKVITGITPEVGYTIAEQAATLGVDKLILGTTKRSLVEQALRGDVIRTVSELLPDEIQLAIYRN
ncbi:MAG TPA: universal stress protein [Bacteroidota bacterium]|nr:universal stress protein [Bacteroidota bacterium]